jgi:protein-disulfide isomerase
MKHEIWFALLACLAVAAAEPVFAQTPIVPPAPGLAQPPGATTPAQPAGDPLALTPDDHVLGKPDAPITIIEYGSLTCPHCADFAAEVLPKLQEKWIDPGKAKLVFRPFPRDDADLHAASIAACAPSDRFYPFIDALFAAQQQWVLATDLKAALARLALLGGMNKTKFDECFDNKNLQDKLLASRLAASQQLSVNSTPTFFINGKRFEGSPTVDAFDAALSKLANS